jgi:glycerol-3-phosphate acyltransferase PlsY
MDRDTLIALAPHYALMLLVVFVVLGIWRTYVGELSLVGEFAIVALIVFTYRPVVKRLGLAPEPWQD